MSNALSPVRWFYEFGRPPRILGLDVARALAILGMVGAHIGDTGSVIWGDPRTWAALVNGRSSILFALLAGISIALMTGRSSIPARESIPDIRLRLVGRGAVIFVIGLTLEMLNTPIAVILTLYGLLYVAVIPFLRWTPGRLLAGASVLAFFGPPLLALVSELLRGPTGSGIDFVLYGSYPITVWMVFILAGMAIGRMQIQDTRSAWLMLGVGVVLSIVGYALGGLGAQSGMSEGAASAVFAVAPHSGGTAEILGSGGFALAVIAVCLLLSQPLRWAALPLGALGSMPLTAYSAHVLSIVLLVGPGGFLSSNTFWAATTLFLLIASTLWSMFFGRGPLERLVGKGATAMAAIPHR